MLYAGKDLAAKGLINREDMDESIDYFLYILPKLLEAEGQENL
jgi:histone arginine demethylase JMJD6